jgi:beta-lactamase regulating signal transducer with metallopeptidase domain
MILPLDWAVKTCLIAAIASGASLSLRRSSSAIRHLMWSAAFCTIILLPLCSLLIPSSWRSNLPAPITRVLAPEQYNSGPIVPAESSALPARSFLPRAFALALRAFTVSIAALPWPALIWLVGCFASAAVLLVGSVRLAWTAHRSWQFLDTQWARVSSELSSAFGMKRRIRLLQSTESLMPVTWGLFRPCVLLPANAQTWSDKHLSECQRKVTKARYVVAGFRDFRL